MEGCTMKSMVLLLYKFIKQQYHAFYSATFQLIFIIKLILKCFDQHQLTLIEKEKRFYLRLMMWFFEKNLPEDHVEGAQIKYKNPKYSDFVQL